MQKLLGLKLMELVRRQFLFYWRYYLGAVITLVLTHYFQSYLPFLAKELADRPWQEVVEISKSKFVLVALGIFIARTSSRLLFFTPARFMERNLRIELLGKIEQTSPLRYKNFSGGQIFQMLYNDIMQMRALIGFALLQLANVVIALMVLLPKLINYNAKLVIPLSALVIAFLFFTFFVYRSQKYWRAVQDLQGDVQNFIIESYNGKNTIKNYHAEQAFVSLFDKNCEEELTNFFKATLAPTFSIPLIVLSVGVAYVWGAHIIQEEGLGASSLVLYSGFVFLLLEPLMFLSWMGIVFSRSKGSWDRISELNESLTTESEEEKVLKENNDFSNKLDHHQNLDLKILFWDKNIEFSLKEMQWQVFIGETGCGKSTVLLRLAEILKLNHLHISYVAQEPYLFNDSVEKNLFLGSEVNRLRKALAYEYIELFGLAHLAAQKEELFALEVGENGKRLSGGQAKRLCLVRSLLSGAPYLIWDDPFSSVDYILEKEIVDKLKSRQEIKNKTIILTSHRLATVRNSDTVVFLDKRYGIVEEGKTSELLENKSKTNEYFQRQLV